MASVSTNTTNQLLKDVYGALVDAVPNNSKIPKMLGKAKFKQPGAKFTAPVRLTLPHGTLWTSAKGSTATNTPIAGESDRFEIDPYEFYIVGDIANSVYRRSRGAGNGKDGATGDARAFSDAKLYEVQGLIKSGMLYKELQLLYGQDDIGVNADSTTTVTAGSPTTTSAVVTFTEASWSGAIWAFLEGALVDAYDASDDSVVAADLTVASVAHATREVTFTGAAAALDALETSAPTSESHYFVPSGWGPKNNPNVTPGLVKILSNTGSLYGISAATYSRWGASSTAVGAAAFTFSTLRNGLVAVANQADMSGRLCLMTSPASVGDLSNSLDDQIEYTSGDGKKAVGSSALMYRGFGAELEIYEHPFVKQGLALMIPKAYTHRVRSHTQELFWDFGKDENESRVPVAVALHDKTGRRLRCGFEEAIFLSKPNCGHIFTGIAPTMGV